MSTALSFLFKDHAAKHPTTATKTCSPSSQTMAQSQRRTSRKLVISLVICAPFLAENLTDLCSKKRRLGHPSNEGVKHKIKGLAPEIAHPADFETNFWEARSRDLETVARLISADLASHWAELFGLIYRPASGLEIANPRRHHDRFAGVEKCLTEASLISEWRMRISQVAMTPDMAAEK